MAKKKNTKQYNWYKQYKENIVNEKRIETYIKNKNKTITFLDKYYQQEWNNKNIVQNDLKNNTITILENLKLDFILKEYNLLKEMSLSETVYSTFTKERKILFWTKIFNSAYGKTYDKNSKFTDEDYFWIILSSVNFMDAFGVNSNSNSDSFFRSHIINAITEYLENNSFNVNNEWNTDALEKAGFFELLFNKKNGSIKIGNFTYEFTTQGSQKEVIVKEGEQEKNRFNISFLDNDKNLINILQNDCKKNFKQIMKEENRKKGYGGLRIQISDSNSSNLSQTDSSKPFLIESEGGRQGKRGDKMFEAEHYLSLRIEKVATEIQKKEGIEFVTSNDKKVKNFLSWYYRNSKRKTYMNFNSKEKKAFLQLQKEIGNVEKSYYNVFCNAIEKSIRILYKEEKQIKLQLGHQKVFTINIKQIKRALRFFSRYRKKGLFDLLKNSESIHFLGNLFSYQSQLGTVGELLAIKNFSSNGIVAKSQGQNYDYIILGEKEKSLGESFQDITVDYEDINFGVNVKHFLSNQSSNIKLYQDKNQNSYSLNSKALIKYISLEDWHFVNYLNINAPYFGNQNFPTLDELEKIFYKYLPQFLRMTGSSLLKKSGNLFYQLNNLIIPSSLLLDELIKQIKEDYSFFTFNNINKKVFQYEDIKNENLMSQCIKQEVSTVVKFEGFTYKIPNGV